MSPRALAAAAVWTAALAGPALGQFPPAGGPPVGYPSAGGGNPYLGGPPPGGPVVAPAQYPGPYPPGTLPPGEPGFASVGPDLPTDTLAGVATGTARGPRGWVGAEYLLFYTKDAPLNAPLAVVSPTAATATFGNPSSRVLVGGSDIEYSNFSGVRVSGGYWITNNESVGVEGNLFFLPQRRGGTATAIGSDILPVLSRPFFDTTTNRQNSRILTQPGAFLGTIRTDANQELWGAEIGPVWRALDRGGRWTVDVLSGFKFLSLEEDLAISDTSTGQRGGATLFQGRVVAGGGTTAVNDRIETSNKFYGGIVGLRTNLHVEAFTFTVGGKLGLGVMDETVRANGSTTLSGTAAATTTSSGGFFVPNGTAGVFRRTEFTTIPELNTNLAVQVTSHLTLTLGYTYLYIDNVVRPGDQLNTRLNSTLLPTSTNFGVNSGVRQAGIPFSTSTYWAQGFNLGLNVGY